MYAGCNKWPVKPDEAEAMKWWQMAAEQGDAEAQFNLGWAYFQGNCMDQAEKWCRKAAKQGHEKAISLLKGMGVEP